MQELVNMIKLHGQNLGKGILKVDKFLNHQVNTELMVRIGTAIAANFIDSNVTKVLTLETSGIPPALTTAIALGNVNILYGRTCNQPITMIGDVYRRSAPSHTKGNEVEIIIAAEYLTSDDRVLIVDDFIATGLSLKAMYEICVMDAKATVVGFAAPIEKSFEKGRLQLDYNVPIVSLVKIKSMDDDGTIIIE